MHLQTVHMLPGKVGNGIVTSLCIEDGQRSDDPQALQSQAAP